MRRLKQRAAAQGVSVEETVRRMLTEATKPSPEELIAEIDRITATIKPITRRPLSEDLIREDRDGGEDGRYRR
jgi:plasmid stability protein